MAKKVVPSLTTGLFQKSLFWLALALLLGGAFRFYNSNWDLKHSFHPDERNILNAASGLQERNGYRVTFFAYGQLPVYLYRATGELLSTPAVVFKKVGNREGVAQGLYWLFLLILGGLVFWFFLNEKLKIPAFGISAFLFLLALVLKFQDLFGIWADSLFGMPLKLSVFVLVLVLSFGFSYFAAQILEASWSATPLYSAIASSVVLGGSLFILPDGWAQILGPLAFTLLVGGLAIWLAWVTRWGRLLLGVIGLWTFLATRDHLGIQYTGYGEVMVIGRRWAAFFSTATIAIIFLFVRRAYQNTGMALLSAGGFAFAAVSIEQAHYCITESFISMMVIVIALFSYEVAKEGSWKNYLLAGAAFGLAMAAKTSSLYYLLILVAGHLALLSKTTRQEWEKADKKNDWDRLLTTILSTGLLAIVLILFWGAGYKSRGVIHDLFHMNPSFAKILWGGLFFILAIFGAVLTYWGIKEFKAFRGQAPFWVKLSGAGGLSLLIFCLLSPWSLLDYKNFSNSMNYEWSVVSEANACYVLQFKDTARYLFHLQNLMHVELWWPLGVTAVAGAVWAIFRLLAGVLRPVSSGYLLPFPLVRGSGFSISLPDFLLLAWFIPYFGFIGSWNTKFIRYMVPLIPVFCIFAAKLLSDLLQLVAKKDFAKKLIVQSLALFVIGGSLFYSLAYMNIYRNPHPWIEASVWIYKNVPSNSMILTEEWDDGLPTGVDTKGDPRVDRNRGPQEYRQKSVRTYELYGNNTDDTVVKKNDFIANLQQGDYLSLACKKLWYTLTNSSPEFKPDGFNVYPVTSRYYRLLWSGLLGYKMVGEFHSFPKVFGWEHPDDMAEESFSVYDHPRAYFFKKVENVSAERMFKLLSSDDYVKGIDRDLMRTITPANVEEFITSRRRYLESKGLLKQLEESAPVTVTPVSAISSKPPPLAKMSSAAKNINIPETPPVSGFVIEKPITTASRPDQKTLEALNAYSANPVIEEVLPKDVRESEETASYQWRAWFSWLCALIALGWLTLPLSLRVFAPMPSGAFSLSKILGFFLFSWTVWLSTSVKLSRFTLGSCWFWFLILAVLAGYGFWHDRKSILAIYAKWKRAWWFQELAFVLAFAVFTLVKINIPHVHDPVGEGYNGGGEAGMDFGFLASVVRGETFPPQNMWMAGQSIGYTSYYGHLMMGVLTKTLGLVPAVTYNLGLITLFALIFSGAFGLAFAFSGRLSSGWIAGILCAVAGNPAGARQARQLFDSLLQCVVSWSLSPLARNYDYFGPTRVIPWGNNTGHTINEFPYFSVLYGDLHAHTLAMPFAMLLIGVIGSIYLSSSVAVDWKKDGLRLAVIGLLVGGMARLNAWEIPVWLLLLGIVLLIRGLSNISSKVLLRGLGLTFCFLAATLTLLGWFSFSEIGSSLGKSLKIDINSQALGGTTLYLAFFVFLGFVASVFWFFREKGMRSLAQRFVVIALGLGAVLGVSFLLWLPYFLDFVPQQNKIMWVLPNIRTSVENFCGVHGFFLFVILASFLPIFLKDLIQWTGKGWKFKGGLERCLDQAAGYAERIFKPQTGLQGMISLGVASLALIWGASWVHWAESRNGKFLSLGFGSAAVAFLFVVVWVRRFSGPMMGLVSVFMVWTALLVTRVIPLFRDFSLFLDLGLFSLIWLLAFFHLGIAVKTFKDKPLSFSYVLVSFFFFVTATIEVFVMSEYFGFGDGMRNNSMFKYGIVAWTLASIASGIFLPKILAFLRDYLEARTKEVFLARVILGILGGLFLSIFFGVSLGRVLQSLQTSLVCFAVLIPIIATLAWALVEGWLGKGLAKWIFIGVTLSLLVFCTLGALPSFGYATFLGWLQKFGGELAVNVLSPCLLAGAVIGAGFLMFEKRKDAGRRMASLGWVGLGTLVMVMVSIYPLAATWRKCHGFTEANRKSWSLPPETKTLNGLEFLNRANPEDAAAIRFLNRHIPGQPCLAEFVGAGYNSWGSRVSIFTGMPALMGWDGHVREWLPQGESDIRARFNATQQIFGTSDPVIAKKYLDAYGVQLIIVGTAERLGTADKRGYPPEGLDKFKSFLPLIYRNPGVEIYYNAPSGK